MMKVEREGAREGGGEKVILKDFEERKKELFIDVIVDFYLFVLDINVKVR